MTEPEPSGVRQPAASFARATCKPVIREVGAPLLRRKDFSTRVVDVEWMHRAGNGQVTWRYRQDRPAMFHFGSGIHACRGRLDGKPVAASLAGPAKLAFVAAGATVDAVFDVPAGCNYLVATFRPDFLAENDEFGGLAFPDSQIGFADHKMTLAAAQLRQELAHVDGVTRLMIESWAVQAWGLLHRRRTAAPIEAGRFRQAELARIRRWMGEHLAAEISVSDLARLVNLGPRQFCRRFCASTGSTPARTLSLMRLDAASTLLATTDRSITVIAIDCGFSQPQHLATAFKRQFGLTPGGFRAAIKT